VIHGENISRIYPAIMREVLGRGRHVAPRGLPTVEVLGCQLRLERPRARILHARGRVINPAFAVAEAVWILSGSEDPWIFDYNDSLRAYADDDVLRGAYGPRLRRWADRVDQLDSVRRLLKAESDSRQAVVQLFDPSRDWAGARDVPCTIGHRFLVRAGALHMHTTMRSQDAWLGLPYDIFASSVLHELLAGWLEVEVGPYLHTIDSLHLYERDIAAARQVALAEPDVAGDAEDVEVGLPWEALDDVLAATIAGGQSRLCGGWTAYASVLASYRSWKAGRREEATAALDTVSAPLRSALKRWYAYLGAEVARDSD
jgi:thymidylate synthase